MSKTTYVRARVNELEKEIFEKKAKALGMTVSDYIRYCCLINPPKEENNSSIERKD